MILTNPQAMSSFTNSNGVNVLVSRVRAEVQTQLDRILPAPSDILSEREF